MQLEPGTSLAHYEIIAPLGKGGMGEVYRAKDTKLGREVAIKVLPEEFTKDAERLARFEREARVLAALSHANIASIFEIGSTPDEASTLHYLVMELAPGEDLSERLRRGPIPVEEAIEIARQIADGLEAAHEIGIIHRDLKPANIKIDGEGSVHVLDFGLAKALDVQESDSDITNSPTMIRAATHAGVILGTAAYMSPEQARGKKVDKRTDIWSFGVVLWEMLTGQRMFLGETISDTLAAVLTKPADLDALPAGTPLRVRGLVERCLARDPKQRLRDIGEARLVLGDPNAAEIISLAATPADMPNAGTGPWKWIALAFLIVTIGLAVQYFRRPSPSVETLYLSIPLPPGTHLALTGIQPGPPVVSPDGTRVAFAAEGKEGSRSLWVRAISEPKARMLADTEGASYPFWSQDGRDIGFFADQKMKRVPAEGGAVLTIADAPSGKGGAWNTDGVVIFCPSFNAPLFKVLATGGTQEPLTKLDAQRGDSSHRFPQFMDDGKHYTYLVRGRSDTENVILFGDLDSQTVTRVAEAESNALVVGNNIVYLRERILVSQPFDQKTATISGVPIPLAENLKLIAGAARMVVAAGPGLLVFQEGEIASERSLIWVDRSGRKIGVLGEPAAYDDGRLSPNGTKLAVEITGSREGTSDIWVLDAQTGNRERVTFEASNEMAPTWSHDGTKIAYASNESGPYQIMVKDVEEGGDARVLIPNDDPESRPSPADWTSSGELIFVTEDLTTGSTMIWTVAEGEPPRRIGASTYRFPFPNVSPDERRLVFGTGIDSGAPGVMVVDFPDANRRWDIGRGYIGFWRRDGSELFFLNEEGALTTVAVRKSRDAFEWGPPEVLFQMTDTWVQNDGDRFLIRESLAADDAAASAFQAILGWEALVKEGR